MADTSVDSLALAEVASSNGGGGSGIVPVAGVRSAALSTAQRAQMSLVAKAGQDSQLLVAVRKQMETLEDRLSSQIARVQQQGDKLRDAAFSRYDSKVGTLETSHPRLERRVAEISGNLRGLSDEMQCQIRRIDQTDSRLWEWRHQLEEDIRAKLTEIEQGFQQISSTVRVQKTTYDDQFKKYNQRLARLEGLMDERVASTEDTHQSIMQLHCRLAEVEDRDCERSRELAIQLGPASTGSEAGCDAAMSAASAVTIAKLEAQGADAARRLETLQSEFHELLTRVESQEERYKSLRTLAETKDEQFRVLSDRLERENWDGRFKEFTAKLQEVDQSRIENSERLEILTKQLDSSEQAREELAGGVRRLQEKAYSAFPDFSALKEAVTTAAAAAETGDADGAEAAASAGAAGLGEVAAMCMARLQESEGRMEALSSQLDSIKVDQELGSRVASLVTALKDIAPKVIAHDLSLKQLKSELSVGTTDMEQRIALMEKQVGGTR